ncbi:MAG: glycosyltransferase family 39 protein [Candidatus Magasanikbacteria bacterium]|nr:glycosyltransferase family 39 protein [Candidatus Magasanikbacteria bacterium]
MFNEKRIYTIILSSCSLIFFFVYIFLYTDLDRLVSSKSLSISPPFIILNQPDEAMNYFFIRTFVLESRFRVPQAYSEIAFSQVHPRSSTVIENSLAPIGFPGFIILCGLLLKILVFLFGDSFFNIFAISLTPFLAALAPLFVFFSLRRLFEEKTAFFSALLLYIMPAWWYYASRPFQHNTIFVFFLILFLYMYSFFLEQGKLSSVKIFFMGLFLSLCVYIRSSEVLWLFVLAGALCFLSRKFWNFKKYFYASLGVLLVLVLFFATQYLYYGHPLGSGYVVPRNGLAGLITSGPQGIPFLQALVAPFGWHPFAIFYNVYHYFGVLFWPWSLSFVFFLISLIFFLYRKDPTKCQDISSKRLYSYLAVFAFVSLYLLLYYGSWSFFDNLAGKPSVASSHVRYFLPLYLGALPFFGVFFSWLSSYFKRIGFVLSILWIFGLSLLSYRVVFNSFEGLNHIKQTVSSYYNWQKEILFYVEPGAVIVTQYADKYLFPHRDIIPGLTSDMSFQAVQALLDNNKQVFYYDLKLNTDDRVLGENMQRYGFGLLAPLWSVQDLELRRIEKNTGLR